MKYVDILKRFDRQLAPGNVVKYMAGQKNVELDDQYAHTVVRIVVFTYRSR